MMKLLKETKGVQHTLAQTVYHGFQPFLKSEDSTMYPLYLKWPFLADVAKALRVLSTTVRTD